MSVYGNNVIIRESVLFLSDKGKQFKKEINEKFRSLKKSSIKNTLKGALKGGINKDIQNKALSFLKSKSSTIFISNIVEEETTQPNGIVTTAYYQKIVLLKDSNIYKLKINLHQNYVILSRFSELKESDIKFPIDIVVKIIENANAKYDLTITKTGAKSVYLYDSTERLLGTDKKLFEIISQYINNEYSGKFEIKLNKLLKSFTIKPISNN